MKNVTNLLILFMSITLIACSADETIDRTLLEQEQQNAPTVHIPDEVQELVEEVVEDKVDEGVIEEDEIDEVIEGVVEEIVTVEPIEEITEETIEEIVDEVVEEIEEKEEESDITTTETCLFSDIEFVSGTPTKIDCLLDLEGKEFNVPTNVILEFDGGDIFNGTLNFGSGGKIDGRLMNSKLEVNGDVKLISEEFEFLNSRWNIVEGQTTSAIAQENNNKLEGLINMVKEMGGNTFLINNLDAYFEVTKVTSTTSNQNFYASIEGINIPSDFHLSMTDNTFLRMYPAQSNISNGTILAVRDVDNVKITGGNLIGDRDLRSYSSDAGEQGTHLLHIHSGRNVTVENVNFIEGSKGGITVYSIGFTFNTDYKPSYGIKILNNKFINNRRMAIAFTDGNDVEIIGNYFEDTGQESVNSDGGNVGYSINIEPFRERTSEGVLIEYQNAFDILVSNNTEVNSRVGFITVMGDNITIDNNNVETRIAHTYVSNIKITNNNLIASKVSEQQFAIFSAGDQSEFVFDNEISNNNISGYGVGISLQTQGVEIFGNQINNCSTGIQITKTIDAQIYDNVINVSNLGVLSNLTYAGDINIEDNTISTEGFHVKLTQLNQDIGDEDKLFTISGNEFINNNKISLYFANGVDIKENIINGGIEVLDSSNVEINSNQVVPNENDGIRMTGNHTNVSLIGNIISEPSGAERFVCINNSSNTPNEIEEINNQCQ